MVALFSLPAHSAIPLPALAGDANPEAPFLQSAAEVISTMPIHLWETSVWPSPDTRCLYAETLQKQICFGDRQPARVWVSPEERPQIGLDPKSISLVRYLPALAIITEPVITVLSGMLYVLVHLSEVQQKAAQITEKARQWGQMYTPGVHTPANNDHSEDDLQSLLTGEMAWYEDYIEAGAHTDEMASVHFYENQRPELFWNDCFCFCRDDNGVWIFGQEVVDGGDEDSGDEDSGNEDSGSEDSGSEDSGSEDSGDECEITHIEGGCYVSPEVNNYCDHMESVAVKQEPESDNEMTIGSELIAITEAYSTADDLDSPPPAKKRKKEYICKLAKADGKPCGKVCNNAKTLSNHKRKDHTGQQTCREMVGGKLCGEVCDNAQALSYSQKPDTIPCNRPARRWWTASPVARFSVMLIALSISQKPRDHTGQKICQEVVNGKPCGKVCNNAKALSNHKSKIPHRDKRSARRWWTVSPAARFAIMLESPVESQKPIPHRATRSARRWWTASPAARFAIMLESPIESQKPIPHRATDLPGDGGRQALR